MIDTWSEIARYLEDNGAIVESVSLPNTRHGSACYSMLNCADVASNMARYDGIEYGKYILLQTFWSGSTCTILHPKSQEGLSHS